MTTPNCLGLPGGSSPCWPHGPLMSAQALCSQSQNVPTSTTKPGAPGSPAQAPAPATLGPGRTPGLEVSRADGGSPRVSGDGGRWGGRPGVSGRASRRGAGCHCSRAGTLTAHAQHSPNPSDHTTHMPAGTVQTGTRVPRLVRRSSRRRPRPSCAPGAPGRALRGSAIRTEERPGLSRMLGRGAGAATRGFLPALGHRGSRPTAQVLLPTCPPGCRGCAAGEGRLGWERPR